MSTHIKKEGKINETSASPCANRHEQKTRQNYMSPQKLNKKGNKSMQVETDKKKTSRLDQFEKKKSYQRGQQTIMSQ